MSEAPSALLLDDGELDDVRAQLEAAGVSLRHFRGGDVPDQVDPPTALFVATARHAPLARPWPRDDESTRIAVVTEDSCALREMLRDMGFDFLVRRPVHPAALRLLLLRALFRGPERRAEARFPIGHPVKVHELGGAEHALLVDLSQRGARVLMKTRPAIGAELKLRMPDDLTGSGELELSSRVLRTARKETGEAEPGIAVALAFVRPDLETRTRLGEVIESRVAGPASFERRDTQRRPFRRQVGGQDERASRVLMGQDISRGGMRIEPHPELRVGDEIGLTVYAEPGEEAIAVRARVVRDDGDTGLALAFLDPSEEVAKRLEGLVSGLPAVEALGEGEVDSLGAVVSEIQT